MQWPDQSRHKGKAVAAAFAFFPQHFTGPASILPDYPQLPAYYVPWQPGACSAGCVSGCYSVSLRISFSLFLAAAPAGPRRRMTQQSTASDAEYRQLGLPPSFWTTWAPAFRTTTFSAGKENSGQLQHIGYASRMAQWVLT